MFEGVSDEERAEARKILEEVRKQRDAAERHRDRALADGGGGAYLFWARIHRELHLTQGRIENDVEGVQ